MAVRFIWFAQPATKYRRPTGETVAFVRFEAVQEIFAVETLPGIRYPDLTNHDLEFIGRAYVLSEEALQLVPEKLKASELIPNR